MFEIHHGEEPEVLVEFRRLEPGPYTKDKVQDLWDKFRSYATQGGSKNILYKVLHNLQHGLCIYCEQKIFNYPEFGAPDCRDREIEHIKAKSVHPALMFAFNNLALSCKRPKGSTGRKNTTCGERKGDKELPILPTDCFQHLFDLDMRNGKIISAKDISTDEKEKVDSCISILNLNQTDLCNKRLSYIQHLKEASEISMDVYHKYLGRITDEGEPFSPTFRQALRGRKKS